MTHSLSTAVEQLQTYEKQGFVFHGSTNPNITELEPRPATDVDTTNEFNNDNAIFAAPSPAASVIFACMSLDKVPKELKGENTSWGVGSGGQEGLVARIPKNWESYISKNTGYVYVLSGETFSGEGSWQVKSKQAVKPTAVIEVSFSDFEKLGGSIVWKEE